MSCFTSPTRCCFSPFSRGRPQRDPQCVRGGTLCVHPLHVESVAWITERKDVLSTLFGLLSLLTYVRYARSRGLWSLAACFGCLVASLLSKQTLVTLPFVFLLLDFWPLGRVTGRFGVAPADRRKGAAFFGVGSLLGRRDRRAAKRPRGRFAFGLFSCHATF